jgi:SAM-dependent methyltransferase
LDPVVTPQDLETYWDTVYAEGDATKSWRQARPLPSLSAIRAALRDETDAPIVDVGGGSSPLAGELVAAGYTDVSVLDVSAAALGLARQRMGDRAGRVTWIVADVLAWSPDRGYALWHDRATLHFFVRDDDRHRYARVAGSAVAPGGYAVIATFAPDGPRTCSGLPVQRSSTQEIAALFADRFTLVSGDHEVHRTPGGVAQSFTWTVLRRRATVTDGGART